MSKLLKPFLAGLIKTGSIEIETANVNSPLATAQEAD
jgi:hypothetical protein